MLGFSDARRGRDGTEPRIGTARVRRHVIWQSQSASAFAFHFQVGLRVKVRSKETRSSQARLVLMAATGRHRKSKTYLLSISRKWLDGRHLRNHSNVSSANT
jgi:hypothetical protein